MPRTVLDEVLEQYPGYKKEIDELRELLSQIPEPEEHEVDIAPSRSILSSEGVYEWQPSGDSWRA